MNEHPPISRSFGLWVIVGWSIVVVFEIAARLWLLVNIPGLMSLPTRNLIVLFVIVDVGFIIGFLVAAYGLARRLEWGRRLFIALSIVRFGVLTFGLFLPGVISSQAGSLRPGQQGWLLGRYAASLVLPVWYLSLAHIRARFKDQTR
ncbi:MAG: hypothetical protein ACE5H9_02880 [Anaerolineae bacterium]